MEQELFLPSPAHWTYGNNWSGSHGSTRFFVTTSSDSMLAEVWNEDVCHELATILDQAEFPVSEEGVEQMRVWLTEQISMLGAI